MKRASIAVAVLFALTLTGCAGGAGGAGAERTSSEGSASSAPLVAETPAETSAPESPDDEFLTRIRAELPEDTVIPDASDEQLLTAAQDACTQIANGTDVLAVQVIEGEQANDLGYFESSAKIGAIAAEAYCPLD